MAILEEKGRQQKKDFIKYCLGGSAVLLGAVFIISIFNECCRKKIRQKKASKPAGLCSNSVHNPEVDVEAAQASVRNSLVVKKYIGDDDMSATFRISASSLGGFPLSSHTLDVAALDSTDVDDFSKEGSSTESCSEESDSNNNTKSAPPPSRKLVFRNSISSLSERTSATSGKKGKELSEVCVLCERPFQTGDDVCESSNPRCSHTFHQQCISSWLGYQNSCPCCSETYVILDKN